MYLIVNKGKSFKWCMAYVEPCSVSVVIIADALLPLAVVSAT